MTQPEKRVVLHHDLDAERALIGCVMLDNGVMDEVEVDPRDFYSPQNAAVWMACIRLHRRSEPIDLVTLCSDLAHMGDLERAGDDERLVELAERVPTSGAAASHARTIRHWARIRALVTGCNAAIAKTHVPTEDLEELLDECESDLSKVFTDARDTDTVEDSRLVATRVMEDLAKRDDEGGSTGIRTGFDGLDRLLGGMEPGQLILLAGRPGMGKSSLARALAETAATVGPTLTFSLEMPSEEWIRGMGLSRGRVDGQRARTGRMTREDWTRITTALGEVASLPLWIDDTPGITPLQLRSRARRVRARCGGLALIVVDYLQLMQPSDRADSTERAVGSISTRLKEIAKELEVPVLALSQLNRELERRTDDKRPRLSDLRHSGSLEQDADVVLFVYREHVYFPKKADPRSAEIIVAKQRSGSTGVVRVAWFGEHTRFEPIAQGPTQRSFAGGDF